MSVLQIPYNKSATVLRCEFPQHWDAESITGVTIGVTDKDGTTLLAATAATLYTSVALSAAASEGDGTITLAGTPGALVRGDRLVIEASDAGAREAIEVEGYNSTTKVVTLRHRLEFAHSSGADLFPLWATYSLDTTTTTTWQSGIDCTITWTPDIAVPAYTELAKVAKIEFASSEAIERFSLLYATERDLKAEDLQGLELEARKRVYMWCESRSMPLNRIVDQDLLIPSIIEMMAYLVASGGGDNWETERDNAWSRFSREFELLSSLPVWTDDDQDQVQDEEEVVAHHTPYFSRGI